MKSERLHEPLTLRETVQVLYASHGALRIDVMMTVYTQVSHQAKIVGGKPV